MMKNKYIQTKQITIVSEHSRGGSNTQQEMTKNVPYLDFEGKGGVKGLGASTGLVGILYVLLKCVRLMNKLDYDVYLKQAIERSVVEVVEILEKNNGRLPK
jgi:lantibiotic modifying enzyme